MSEHDFPPMESGDEESVADDSQSEDDEDQLLDALSRIPSGKNPNFDHLSEKDRLEDAFLIASFNQVFFQFLKTKIKRSIIKKTVMHDQIMQVHLCMVIRDFFTGKQQL